MVSPNEKVLVIDGNFYAEDFNGKRRLISVSEYMNWQKEFSNKKSNNIDLPNITITAKSKLKPKSKLKSKPKYKSKRNNFILKQKEYENTSISGPNTSIKLELDLQADIYDYNRAKQEYEELKLKEYNDPKFIYNTNLKAADKEAHNKTFSWDTFVEPTMRVLSPTQHIGAAFDYGFGRKGYWESIYSGNSGIFSEEFAKYFPTIAAIGNLIADGGIYGLGKGAINGIRSFNRYINGYKLIEGGAEFPKIFISRNPFKPVYKVGNVDPEYIKSLRNTIPRNVPMTFEGYIDGESVFSLPRLHILKGLPSKKLWKEFNHAMKGYTPIWDSGLKAYNYYNPKLGIGVTDYGEGQFGYINWIDKLLKLNLYAVDNSAFNGFSSPQEFLEMFKKGGGIYIKKKNRGKFTDYCGGKVTNECISKAKNSSNPTLRKRAIFAANARKWKHLKGGILDDSNFAVYDFIRNKKPKVVFNLNNSNPYENLILRPLIQYTNQIQTDDDMINLYENDEEPIQEDNNKIQNIVNLARSFVGGKYIPGGHSPKQGGFDCSGLIGYVFNLNGIKSPWTTFDIFKSGIEVPSLNQAKVGDVICTPGTGQTKKHVKLISRIDSDGTIYTIEAKGRKYGIVESPLTKTNNIITIRRLV